MNFVLSVLNGKIPGWSKFEDARRAQTRDALVAFARELLSAKTEDSGRVPAVAQDRVLQAHLDKVLTASLPLTELGAESLVAIAELLRTYGKK